MKSHLGESGIRATGWKIRRKPCRSSNHELEECSNQVAGKKNEFRGKLLGQDGRYGFKRDQRSAVREATRIGLTNLSLDACKCGKPHQKESRKNTIAKKIVKRAIITPAKILISISALNL
ncbi:hypothetical protein L1987_03013 [Smallanthus sonchifolius]|uniref:Uncharacterized protein n=1 Tax=Smallanthus sonchifolius TaxID=185202 RepID=A0ACB9K9D3_9ASTR|nr:hypothetical protein L1987_03013 [Smallanthus sonchifolius]